ncbi:MAG: signal recognition particle-docking protein FtsY [Ruthenibacterium sp.]
MGLFEKLGESLKKTRDNVFGSLSEMIRGSEITDEMYEELEEKLIMADTGAAMAVKLVDELYTAVNEQHLKTGGQAMDALKSIIKTHLAANDEMHMNGRPAVILIIGVNGVGKTTSIAKLAKYYKQQGKSVLLAAGDTFRAAAQEQLDVWAKRVDVPLVRHGEGADPAAVIFDAVHSATAKNIDVVICDTAGRLHTKKNLMDELSKISRVVKKANADASVETLLVLDAITGQNAISQASQFIDAANATGIILTKLDGTAKGGAVISIREKLGLPVRFMGVGEGVDDLMVFDADAFAEALFLQGNA